MLKRGTIDTIVTALPPFHKQDVLGTVIDALAKWYRRAWHRHTSRIALSRLSQEHLRDIGLSPAEAQLEWQRPFWR